MFQNTLISDELLAQIKYAISVHSTSQDDLRDFDGVVAKALSNPDSTSWEIEEIRSLPLGMVGFKFHLKPDFSEEYSGRRIGISFLALKQLCPNPDVWDEIYTFRASSFSELEQSEVTDLKELAPRFLSIAPEPALLESVEQIAAFRTEVLAYRAREQQSYLEDLDCAKRIIEQSQSEGAWTRGEDDGVLLRMIDNLRPDDDEDGESSLKESFRWKSTTSESYIQLGRGEFSYGMTAGVRTIVMQIFDATTRGGRFIDLSLSSDFGGPLSDEILKLDKYINTKNV